MSRAVLSVGSNLGDRAAALQLAVEGLRPELIAVSPVYETEPWGVADDQPCYLNAILIAESDVDSHWWLRRAGQLEEAAGRTREGRRWAPRTLDVDVVSVDQVVSADPALTLPHPRAHRRAFVLLPWLALDPAAVLPGRGRVADLVGDLPPEELASVRPRPELALR